MISVLDALARLSCARPAGEVHAIGLRSYKTSGRIEFVIAANGIVRRDSVKWLRETIDAMTSLSRRYHAEGLEPEEGSPSSAQKVMSSDFYREQHALVIKIVTFGWAKTTRRLLKSRDILMNSIKNIAGVREPEQLRKSLDMINIYHAMILFLNRQTEGENPKSLEAILADTSWLADEIHEIWSHAWDFRKWRKADERSGGHEAARFAAAHLTDGADVLDVFNSLEKATSMAIDAFVLIAATRSSTLHHAIFPKTLNVESVRFTDTTATSTPRGFNGWMAVLTNAIGAYNDLNMSFDAQSQAKVVFHRYFLKQELANELCNRLTAANQFEQHNTVHCEVRLMHFLHQETTKLRAPEAFNHLGVSKPTCGGCAAFIRAYNKTHGTSFVTHASYAKIYHPYLIPDLVQMGMPRDPAKATVVTAFRYLAEAFLERWGGVEARGAGPATWGCNVGPGGDNRPLFKAFDEAKEAEIRRQEYLMIVDPILEKKQQAAAEARLAREMEMTKITSESRSTQSKDMENQGAKGEGHEKGKGKGKEREVWRQ